MEFTFPYFIQLLFVGCLTKKDIELIQKYLQAFLNQGTCSEKNLLSLLRSNSSGKQFSPLQRHSNKLDLFSQKTEVPNRGWSWKGVTQNLILQLYIIIKNLEITGSQVWEILSRHTMPVIPTWSRPKTFCWCSLEQPHWGSFNGFTYSRFLRSRNK